MRPEVVCVSEKKQNKNMQFKNVKWNLCFLFLAQVATGFTAYCPNRLPVRFTVSPTDAADYQSMRVYLKSLNSNLNDLLAGSTITEVDTEYVDESLTYLKGLDGNQNSFTFSVSFF